MSKPKVVREKNILGNINVYTGVWWIRFCVKERVGESKILYFNYVVISEVNMELMVGERTRCTGGMILARAKPVPVPLCLIKFHVEWVGTLGFPVTA